MKNLFKVFGIIILAMIVGFAGCDISGSSNGGDDGKKPGEEITGPVALTSVTLPAIVYVPVKGTSTITPTFQPYNAANKNVTWSSANSSIASVNEDGVVTGGSNADTETTITVTTEDGGFTATCTVKVVSVPDKITVTGAPYHTHRIGEPLITDGITVIAHSDEVSYPLNISDVKFSGFPATSAGSRPVTVSYTANGITRSAVFNVTVTDVSLTGIDFVVGNTYYEGDTFDVSKLTITASFSDSTSETIPYQNCVITPADGTKFAAAEASRAITVTYGTANKTTNITVSAITLEDIEIISAPNKIFYDIGEADSLNLAGLVVIAKYNKGEEPAAITNANISGYNKNTRGPQEITITFTYKGVSKTATFEVFVGLELESIAITSQPVKTNYYQGEELDLTGMVVTATFKGINPIVVDNNSLYKEGFNNTKDATLGEQTIKVQLGEAFASFKITMKKLSFTDDSMVISTQPGKTRYNLGEELDLSGLRVRVVYNNKSSYVYHEYNTESALFSASGFSSGAAGSKTITITFKNLFDESNTKTATYNVTVNPWTVTFSNNSGDTEADPDTKTVTTQGGNVGTLPTTNPTKADWIFNGWNTQNDGLGDEFTSSSSVSNHTIVYAKWIATVTFDKNGGDTDASPITKQFIYPATTIDALPTTNPTKSGYAFYGWNTQADGKGTEFHANTPLSGSATVYAEWTQSYVITFNANGPADSNYPQTKLVDPLTATKIDALPGAPSGSGWVFQGWNTQADGSGTAFTAATTVSGHIEVYAQWKIVITFNPGSGAWTSAPTASRTAEIAVNTPVARPADSRLSAMPLGLLVSGTTIPTIPTAVSNFTCTWHQSGSIDVWNFSEPLSVPTTFQAQYTASGFVNLGGVSGGNILAQSINYSNANEGEYTLVMLNNLTLTSAPPALSGAERTLNLRGNAAVRTITRNYTGTNAYLLDVSSDAQLVLGDNITLAGQSGNTSRLVYVRSSGKLIMDSATATITGSEGGGVEILSGGTFTMENGTISSNSAIYGGGVYNSGTFTMSGGTISSNTNTRLGELYGGGVMNYGTFTMEGGTITNNRITNDGGTVAHGGGVYNGGTFTMSDGTISNNTATARGYARGGGVCNSGTFTMSGGTISGNTASTTNQNAYGGGVFNERIFNMSGGTISSNKTTATDSVYNRGGGVYVSSAVYNSVSSFVKSGTAVIQSNTITGNTATYGTQVYVAGSTARYRSAAAGASVTLDSNTATNWGQ